VRVRQSRVSSALEGRSKLNFLVAPSRSAVVWQTSLKESISRTSEDASKTRTKLVDDLVP
jgi:hypothetical protein